MSELVARKPCRSATELAAAVRDGHISAARIARDTLDAGAGAALRGARLMRALSPSRLPVSWASKLGYTSAPNAGGSERCPGMMIASPYDA